MGQRMGAKDAGKRMRSRGCRAEDEERRMWERGREEEDVGKRMGAKDAGKRMRSRRCRAEDAGQWGGGRGEDAGQRMEAKYEGMRMWVRGCVTVGGCVGEK